MKISRERWTTAFGSALVAGLGVTFPVYVGTAWRHGRYIIHINAENGDASAIGVFAMEEPSESGGHAASTDVKNFSFHLENDPIAAARTVIAGLAGG